MHGLGRPDADQDSQHFHAAGSLRHRRIEAVAALFDGWHMEAGSVGDRLDVKVGGQIVIGSRNRGELAFVQIRDRLWKHEIGIEIGVITAAAVASPPTRVQGELHEICEAQPSAGSGGSAARQGAKLLQIDWIRSLRL